MFEQYRGLRKENYILAFGRLVTGLGSMIWPMMTLILSQKMGVSAKGVSILLAAAMVGMAPAIYLGGKISDKRDKKQTIVVLDLMSTASFVTCAFIPMSWITIGLLFLGSVCQNMENPAYNALTADLTVTEDRDRSFSLQYLCANLGLVMSPTLAGLLFRDHLWLSFLINGLSILCSALLIQFFVRDTAPSVETGAKAEYQREKKGESVLQVLKNNRLIILFILVLSGYFAVYQLGYVYLIPLDLAEMYGETGALIYGSVTSVNCVVVVLFTPVVTRLFGTRSEPSRITAGVSLCVLGFVLFAVFRRYIPMYYVSMIILTWGEVFALTADSPYLSRRIPSSHRGRLNGIVTVVRTVITSLSQLAIGWIYSGGGSEYAWIAIMAAGAATICASCILIIRDRIDYPNLYQD